MMNSTYNAKPHPGIRIDSIPATGVPGVIFALGTVVIFLIGVPEVREFAPFALLGGGLVAAGLHFWHNQTRW